MNWVLSKIIRWLAGPEPEIVTTKQFFQALAKNCGEMPREMTPEQRRQIVLWVLNHERGDETKIGKWRVKVLS